MAMSTTLQLFIVSVTCFIAVQALGKDHDRTVLNGKQKKKFWDCLDLRVTGGYEESGLFYIYPNTTNPIKVFCRFELNNTFTSIMGQRDGSIGFKRRYGDYVSGFGYQSTNNFWLGLNNIKRLTDIGHVNMRVTLQDWNRNTKEVYYKFSLGPAFNAYFSHYQGTLPDDFSYNNGMPFSTYDRDRTAYGCAKAVLAGWWYNHCTYTLPTGHYYQNGYYPVPAGHMGDGIFYADWYGVNYSLLYIRIDLAPNP